MRALVLVVGAVLASSATRAEPDLGRPKNHLESEYFRKHFTVTWEAPAAPPADAELEIGDGSGHGGTLGWFRFRPGKDWVGVLLIQFDEGWQPYKSQWPPDRAPVTVKSAHMKPDAYAALLRDLAAVNAAKLKPVELDAFGSSTTDLWASARLNAGGKALVDLNWAGYDGATTAVESAKPRAVAALARDAVQGLDFKDHAPTDEERGWASAKFARDWTKFKDLKFHWWVRERYIETIGVVGNKAILPTLRDILASDPPKDGRREASDERCVYHAINAVTRLLKTDVRDTPVEEMDLEKTRRKVLDLLRDRK